MNRKQRRIGKQRRQRECGIDVTQSYIRLLCGVTTTINPSQVLAAIWAVRVSMGMTQQPVMVRFACISVLALSLLTLSTHTGLIIHSPMAYARDPCDMVFSLYGPTFSGTFALHHHSQSRWNIVQDRRHAYITNSFDGSLVGILLEPLSVHVHIRL